MLQLIQYKVASTVYQQLFSLNLTECNDRIPSVYYEFNL